MVIAPAASAADGTNSCGMANWLQLCVTGTDPLAPGGNLRVEFSGNVPDGQYTAGDTVAIAVPADLTPPNGSSYDLKDPSGEVVAVMKVNPGGNVVLTFTDFVETHTGVNLEGFLQARLRDDLDPGTDNLTWTVDGVTFKTPVEVGEGCTENCTAMPTKASKYAFVNPASPNQIATGLQTPTMTQDDTFITWTDAVGPGQEIDCTAIGGSIYDKVVNGSLVFSGSFVPTIVSCNATSITATFALGEKGNVYVLQPKVTITDQNRESWTDTGTVTVNGDGAPVAATAVKFDGGGSGGGSTPTPTSTTSTSTSTTPSSTSTTPSETSTTPSSTSTTPSETSTTPSSTSMSTSTTPPVATTPPSGTSTPSYPVGAPTDAHRTGGSIAWILLMIGGFVLLVGAFVPVGRSISGRHSR